METIKGHQNNMRSSSVQPVILGAPMLLFMPSGGEFLIIFFAVLLLFGGKKIPELMRGFGKGIREFNDARDGIKRSLEEGVRQAEREAEEKKRLAAQNPAEGSGV